MKITVKRIEKENLLREESLFHTANGYLGVRGNFEEGYLEELPSVRGSYINGVYENIPMEYSERLYGFPTESQRMISLPDLQTTKFILDGENVSFFEGEVLEYERILDFEKGCQIRKVSWKSPKGKNLSLIITRVASFLHKHLFFTKFEISSTNYFGKIQINSSVGGFKKRQENKNDPRVASVVIKGFEFEKTKISKDIPFALYSTESSKIKVAIFQKHTCSDSNAIVDYHSNNEGFSTTIDTVLRKNQMLTIEKYTTVSDSLRNPKDYEDCAFNEMQKALSEGGNLVLEDQKSYMKDFWEGCRVEIDEDKPLGDKLAFAQFQLLQCAGTDAFGFVAAKGLSGEGYEGHYFWDTEIYVFPFFLLTRIETAESLLKFRYNMLDKAKEHARIMGHSKGALYPWRTINGGECSGYFPSGSAQYHINSDIAHTFIQYFEYTRNLKFMEKYGFEVLYETALLFLDTGHYDRKGRFCIDCVTGPDEYSCIVNNNYYTNFGAQQNMLGVCRIFKELQEKGMKIPSFVEERIINDFEKAANSMYLPFDEDLGIFAQDDSFLNKKNLDLKTISKEKFPLLLNFHPLFLYRHQICKQADTVLAHMLYGEEIDFEKQKKSFDYYEKITTHDSTLSECVFCIQACRLGYADKAYRYFLDSSETDLEDKHGNTKDGLHIANLGGAYLALILGFSGFHITHEGILSFKFHPFGKVKGYHFRLTQNDCLLKADVNPSQVVLSLLKGRFLKVEVNRTLYDINSNKTIIKF
ncbi:MAG: family 65 glycosyl hydrolase [Sphaerochaetaceae bacterium]|nr:family 65 glycosyl hydrolase [Sphaerochaetaceae bacterium]